MDVNDFNIHIQDRSHLNEEKEQNVPLQPEVVIEVKDIPNFQLHCNICKQKFFPEEALKQHIISRNHHDGVYLCPTCDLTCSQKENLATHLSTDSSKVSGESAASNSNLSNQIVVPPQKHLYCCHQCDQKFLKNLHLLIHLRSHTGKTTFICQVCEKKFLYLSALEKHLRSHTGEQPYTCLTCRKQFSLQANLKKHAIMHTGDKPYACQICRQKFRTQANLKRHSTNQCLFFYGNMN